MTGSLAIPTVTLPATHRSLRRLKPQTKLDVPFSAVVTVKTLNENITICRQHDDSYTFSSSRTYTFYKTTECIIALCRPIPAINKNPAAKYDKQLLTTVQQLPIAKPDIC